MSVENPPQRDLVKFGLSAPEAAIIEDRKAQVPAGAWCRGMFLKNMVDVAKANGKDLGFGNYIAFKQYAVVECMDIISVAAKAVHPALPLQEAMEQVGRVVYPNFAESMVGRAIFSIAGRDFEQVASLGSRAYSVSMQPSSITIEANRQHHTVVLMEDVWTFVEAYQVGIWKGALEVCGASDSGFEVEQLGPAAARYTIDW